MKIETIELEGPAGRQIVNNLPGDLESYYSRGYRPVAGSTVKPAIEPPADGDGDESTGEGGDDQPPRLDYTGLPIEELHAHAKLAKIPKYLKMTPAALAEALAASSYRPTA